MAVPNIFGSATSAIPLSQLDTNFATPVTIGNTAVQLGNTVTSFGNVTLTNVTISSGNVTVTSPAIFPAGTAAAPAITTTGDTNTGIFFPAADTIAFTEGGTESARFDSAGNFGLGVTPAPWSLSGLSAVQVKDVSLAGFSNAMYLNNNVYYNGGWKFIGTGYGLQYTADRGTGAFSWNISTASGTAGNAISFTQAMTLDASGNLGVGTTSPAHKIEASSSTNNYIGVTCTVDGNSASRFKNTQRDWLVGVLGSTSGALGFYDITAGAERARIDSSGLMLVGTTSQLINESTLSLLSAGNTMSVKTTGGAGTVPILCWNNAASGTINLINFFFGSSITGGGTITTNGTTTTLNNPSDYRLKNITGALTTSGAFIDALKPLVGTYKSNGSAFVGFVADQVKEVSPSSVQGEKDAVDEKGNPIYQSLAYASPEIITNLVAEIQDLRKRLAALESN